MSEVKTVQLVIGVRREESRPAWHRSLYHIIYCPSLEHQQEILKAGPSRPAQAWIILPVHFEALHESIPQQV